MNTRVPIRRAATVLVNVLAIALVVAAAHAAPMREYVRRAAEQRLSREARALVSIGAVRYNVFTLAVEADDVAVWSVPPAASLHTFARRVQLRLSAPALLRGRIAFDEILASRLDVVAVTSGSGLDLRRLTVRLSGDRQRLDGRVELGGPGTIHTGTPSVPISKLTGRFALKASGIDIQELAVSGAGVDVDLSGHIDDVWSETVRASLRGPWRADASIACAEWLASHAACEAGLLGAFKGSFALDGRMFDPVLRVEGRSTSRQGRRGASPVIDGAAVVTRRTIEVPRLHISLMGGTGAFRGVVRIDEGWSLSNSEVVWDHIDARRPLRAVGIHAPFGIITSGYARLRGSLLDPASLRIDGRGIAEATVESARVAHMPEGWEARIVTELDLSGSFGQPHFAGWLRFVARRGGDVLEVAGDASVSGNIGGIRVESFVAHAGANRLQGSLYFHPQTQIVEGSVEASEVQLPTVTLPQGIATVQWSARRAAAVGAAQLTSGGLFDAHVVLDDVAFVGTPALKGRPPAAGHFASDLRLRGDVMQPQTLRVDADVVNAEVLAGGLHAVLVHPGRIVVEAGLVQEADVDLDVNGLAVRLARDAYAQPWRLQVDGPLPDLGIDLGEAPLVSVDAEVDRDVTIHSASVRWQEATVDGSGRIPAAFLARLNLLGDGEGVADRVLDDVKLSEASGRFEVRGFPVGVAIGRLRPGLAPPVSGTVDAVLTVRSERPSLDAIVAEGSVQNGWLEVGGVRLQQEGVAPLDFQFSKGEVANLHWRLPGGRLTLHAGATLGAEQPDLEGALTGELDLAAAVAERHNALSGIARFDLSMRRRGGRITGSGYASISNGQWIWRERGTAVTDANGRLVCTEDGCRVESFSARLNDGTFTIDGDLPLPGQRNGAALRASLRAIGFELPRGTRHDADADLQFSLAGTTPRVTGSVTVWPGTVSDSLVVLASLIPDPPPAPVGGDDAVSSVMSRIALDLRLESGSPVVFDSEDLQLEVTADLRIQGTGDAPRLRGEIAALGGGRVHLAGRTWDLEQGVVRIDHGPEGANARIVATMTAPISRYTVQIALLGPIQKPTVVMSATPPLPQSDLASLVLTGSTGASLTDSGQRLATLVSAELLSSVGRVVGVDAVRIEQDQSALSVLDVNPVARVTVSKRVTPRLEVVYSQALDDGDDIAWILVLRPRRQSLELRTTLRASGEEAYELRQALEFGRSRTGPSNGRQVRSVAPTVGRIDLVGLSPHEARMVRSRMVVRTGKPFTMADWRQDRDALKRHFHERGQLRARIRASRQIDVDGSYHLTYDITPGPFTRIETIGYEIDDDISAALREVWSTIATEQLLEEELSRVMNAGLVERGFLEAQVSTRLDTRRDGERLTEIHVIPGSRTSRRSIVFMGNQLIPAADLRRAIDVASLGARLWLDPSSAEAPVTGLYQRRGFLAAEARASRTIDQGHAILTVQVKEGAAFAVGAVTILGTAALSADAARASLALVEGTTYTDDGVADGISRLRTTYSRTGFLDAVIESSTRPRVDAQAVDVVIAVQEGAPSIVTGVRVAGLDETSRSLVERTAAIAQGGAVDTAAIDEAQQRLYATGIFRSVGIDLAPTGEEDRVPPGAEPVLAVVTVEERPRWRLRYGVQFGPTTTESLTSTRNGSSEPGGTFDLQRRNLFGQGVVLGGGAIWSGAQHRLRGTASASTLAGRYVGTTFSIERANQDRTSDDGLHILDRRTRAVLEQRWRRGRVRSVEVAYGFDVDYRHLELRATTAEALPLRARLADLNFTVTYDSRDNRLNPHRGTFHTSRVEAGLGWWLSEIAFARYQVQHFTYRPVGAATLASALRFGAVDVDAERDPASMLLFFTTGGSTSVRGYPTDSLTPAYALGVPMGGTVLLVVNQELRLPLTRWLGVVGFVDAGNTFTGFDTFSLGGLAVGAGAGVRIDTPVAVLRLDAALPVPQQPGRPATRWYASIGQTF